MKEKKASPFSILWSWSKGSHRSFIVSVVLAFLAVAASMGSYVSLAAVIRGIAGKAQMPDLVMPLSTLGLCYLMQSLFSVLSTAISHKATYSTLKIIRKKLTAKLSRMSMGTIMDTPSGVYRNILCERVEGMESTLAHLIPEMSANLLVPLFIAVYIFIIDWRMGIASLLTTLIGIVAMSLSVRSYAPRWAGAVACGRTMSNAIIEYIGGIKVVKAFSQAAGSYRKYSDAVKGNADYYVSWMADNQRYMACMQSVMPAVLLFVLPAGLFFWHSGSLEIADLLTVVVLSLGFASPLIAALTFVDELAVVSNNVGEIQSVLDAPEMVRPDKEVKLASCDIRMENVSFSYHENTAKVLNDITLGIPQGRMTAFVGPSGSGKSTAVKLIANLYDPTEGKITLGGVDMKNIPMHQLNSLISYVSQDVYLFDTTIMENIRMGKPSASDEEVIQAARAACCDEFIMALEDGYSTKCGSGGGHLSGGERQRISIARAILKDAPVVILDEATSSVDPENEALIQSAISSLAKDKTLIVIAHRLNTVVGADKLVLINEGCKEAEGSHEELLSSSALYRRLWENYIAGRDSKEDLC